MESQLIVSVDGFIGAGKSTLIERLFQKTIVVLKYYDQLISGITKDIGGEVLYEKDCKYYLLRGSYPVFSEINILEEQ